MTYGTASNWLNQARRSVDETSFIDWLFKAFAAACMAVIGYFTKCLVDDVRVIERDAAETKLENQKLRTHVSENYATKTDMHTSRLEYKDELKRLHERLDHLPRDIIQLIRKEQ